MESNTATLALTRAYQSLNGDEEGGIMLHSVTLEEFIKDFGKEGVDAMQVKNVIRVVNNGGILDGFVALNLDIPLNDVARIEQVVLRKERIGTRARDKQMAVADKLNYESQVLRVVNLLGDKPVFKEIPVRNLSAIMAKA